MQTFNEPVIELSWHEAVDLVRPHVVKISTPQGWGSGFVVASSKDKTLLAVATAAHVVQHAHAWQEPIRIETSTGKVVLLVPQERAIFLADLQDTAAIVLARGDLDLPEAPHPLVEKNRFLKIGNEVGWLGFPVIAPNNMCFFAGRVSARTDHEYLIDGIAINGVSGGPTFTTEVDGVRVIGAVSAYKVNRATGEPLPGLCVVEDVSHLHDVVSRFKSIDEAQGQQTPPEPVAGYAGGDSPASPANARV